MPATGPKAAVFEGFGIEPKTDVRIASGDEFRKDPFALFFAVNDLKVPPAESLLLGCPLGAEKMRQGLFGQGGKEDGLAVKVGLAAEVLRCFA